MLGTPASARPPSAAKADLRQGDAQALDFPDASFDTVLCALGLCAIPGRPARGDRDGAGPAPRRPPAAGRSRRRLRVGAAAVQWLYERITIPLAGEHFRRRQLSTCQNSAC